MVTVVPSTADLLEQWAEQLVDVVNQALATTTGGAISRAFVSPGIPVLDCCPQLTVDVRALGFENTSPQSPVTVIGKRAATQSLQLATLVVTIARCSTGVTEEGAPQPIIPASTQQAIATVINQDIFAAWNGIQQAIMEGELFAAPCMAVYMDPAVPLPNSGGCVGWVLQLRPAISGYSPL